MNKFNRYPRQDKQALVSTSSPILHAEVKEPYVPTENKSDSRAPLRVSARRGGRTGGTNRVRGPRAPRRPKRGYKDYTVGDAMAVAEKAWGYAKYFARYLNVEEKIYDNIGSGTYSTSNTIANLTNIAQGADWNNRDGLSILLQDIFFSLIVTMNTSATATQLRVIIFVDNDNRGVDPAASDLLETGTTPYNLIAPLNHYSAGRFKVLHDSLHLLGFYKPSSQVSLFRDYNRHVFYQGTAAADGSDWKGQLYLLITSNESTNLPTATWYFRTRFTDN